ncbi:hypothetical protein [Caldimonas brevitalea]|uniref:hypothetical protein n=1 Tax=Caldimonas brevitalea TaxID=413882 RepID=UPI00069AFF92|nr:hypothetical protein [Caldimonas brevitalea]
MSITVTQGPLGGIRIGTAHPQEANRVELSGVAVQTGADGGLRVQLGQLSMRHLRLAQGAAQIDIAQATLKDVAATLTGPVSAGGLELRRLSVEEVQLQGIRVSLPEGLPAGVSVSPGSATGPWRLDALAGLEGVLRAFVTDAAWIVDADVKMPIARGQLDFDAVVVEHFGPNSVMGLSRGGLYVDAPNLGRRFLAVFTSAQIPGATFEERGGWPISRVAHRGRLDLQAFVSGLLARGGGAPLGKAAGPHVEATLDRTRLGGELQLGDGALGTERCHLVLAGHARGKNSLKLTAEVLGEELVVRLPELSASHATFELFGKTGCCGPVVGELRAQLEGLRPPPGRPAAAPSIVVTLDHLGLRHFTLGEVDTPNP